MIHIGELPRIVYPARFDADPEAGNPRRGRVEVLVLRDLSRLMPASGRRHADALHDAWSAHRIGLGGEDDVTVAAIDHAIKNLRDDIVAVPDSPD